MAVKSKLTKKEMAEDLKRRIMAGDLPPGRWLVERELCSQYGLSRTPVREILRDLSDAGLVERMPSKGYQAKRLRVEEIIDLFNAREAVEGGCARLACLVEASGLAPRIEELKRELDQVDIERDAAQGVAVGRRVHQLIMETANNGYLAGFYQRLSYLSALTRNMTKTNPRIEGKSKGDHARILDALAGHDADECERLMREHLRSTCQAIVQNYLSLTGSFELRSRSEARDRG